MRRSLRDLLVIFITAVVLFAVIFVFDIDLREFITDFLDHYEDWELDELLVIAIFLVFAGLIYSYRRWQELLSEVAARKHVEERLKELNQELEDRVRQRTAQLSESHDRIEVQLLERQVLIQEIHHRVKNNLSVIISLLRLRSQYTRDPECRLGYEELEDRIYAMAAAHEMLYQSENLKDIDVAKFLGKILQYLYSGLKPPGKAIDLSKDFETATFDLDTAIPLGLILTELVSNSFKHAFADQTSGTIGVSLNTVGENEFDLIVKDDGSGIIEPVDLNDLSSLGLDLVVSYAEQLHGSVAIDGDSGTEVRVRFTEVPKSRRFELK